jgi:hypothetical protein
MADLAQTIWNATHRPLTTGAAQPVFTATVLAVGPPLRIQADDGAIQLEAVAVTGYTPVVAHHVLALRAGSTVYVLRIP